MKVKWWICGSRTAKSYVAIKKTLDDWFPKYDIIVRTGGANGVDKLAEHWARKHDVEMEPSLIPEWDKYGKGAGFIRNKEGIDWADRVFAVWNGESRGTKHCIDYGRETGKVVVVVRF